MYVATYTWQLRGYQAIRDNTFRHSITSAKRITFDSYVVLYRGIYNITHAYIFLYYIMYSGALTHSLARSLTRSLTHLLAHSLTLTHSLTHSLTHTHRKLKFVNE